MLDQIAGDLFSFRLRCVRLRGRLHRGMTSTSRGAAGSSSTEKRGGDSGGDGAFEGVVSGEVSAISRREAPAVCIQAGESDTHVVDPSHPQVLRPQTGLFGSQESTGGYRVKTLPRFCRRQGGPHRLRKVSRSRHLRTLGFVASAKHPALESSPVLLRAVDGVPCVLVRKTLARNRRGSYPTPTCGPNVSCVRALHVICRFRQVT